ncbi:MAG: SDR family oxidoreductase [Dehalococcoidales bacterium]|nr:SDR family oxidoreductase [Dehalococcoidales bacterium]
MTELNDIGPLTISRTGLARDTLEGKVAVVTGGAGNIGLGTARSLAWLGASIVIVDISSELGNAAEEFINSENRPGSALFVQTDVSSEESMKAMAAKVFTTYGKVDILVNSAMNMSLGEPVLKSSVSRLDKQYEIATRGTMIAIQQFVPGMIERHYGVVTYLTTGFKFPVGQSTYCAVKSATTSLMMSLAAELGPVEKSGVGVFTFLPAGVGSPRSSEQRPSTKEARKMPGMAGYEGVIPAEDGGAALAYCITRADEIHGSGVTIYQAFHEMNWQFPKPETAPVADYHRIRDSVMSLAFGYMGTGFPNTGIELRPIHRRPAD